MLAAIEDEHVAARVEGDARGRPHLHALGQLQTRLDRAIAQIWRRLHLRGIRSAEHSTEGDLGENEEYGQQHELDSACARGESPARVASVPFRRARCSRSAPRVPREASL